MPTSRFQGGSAATSTPPIRTRPALARLKPASSRSSVDLPDPDGPSSAKNSPGAIESEMSRSTTLAP